MKTLVTHSGSFHADDVFALATITLALSGSNEEWNIVRTRDEAIIQMGDLVVDVGGIYDPSKGRFDHHQEGVTEVHDDGIPFASFGLVWKKYGLSLCGGSESVFKKINLDLVIPIDAHDNGISISTNIYKDIYPYTIGRFISSFEPPYDANNEEIDEAFLSAVKVTKDLLKREISKISNRVSLEQIVEDIYQKTEDKRIIVLDQSYPYGEVLERSKEPIFVVSPRRGSGDWSVKSIRIGSGAFDSRKNLPVAWAGKKGEELARISGVKDAIFCHNGRFIAVAGSKEGALSLAKIALAV